MPRSARVVIPGCPHHITQRGNNRQPVFFVDVDRSFYLATLREQSEKYGLGVDAYCLMGNHDRFHGNNLARLFLSYQCVILCTKQDVIQEINVMVKYLNFPE